MNASDNTNPIRDQAQLEEAKRFNRYALNKIKMYPIWDMFQSIFLLIIFTVLLLYDRNFLYFVPVLLLMTIFVHALGILYEETNVISAAKFHAWLNSILYLVIIATVVIKYFDVTNDTKPDSVYEELVFSKYTLKIIWEGCMGVGLLFILLRVVFNIRYLANLNEILIEVEPEIRVIPPARQPNPSIIALSESWDGISNSSKGAPSVIGKTDPELLQIRPSTDAGTSDPSQVPHDPNQAPGGIEASTNLKDPSSQFKGAPDGDYTAQN